MSHHAHRSARGRATHRPSVARRRTRAVLFRVLAILLGLSTLVVAELGLRLAEIPASTARPLALAEVDRVRPLFELTEDGSRRAIAQSRLNYFRPDSFPVPKNAGTYRIFVVGGSTVQGRPFGTETAFSTWLRLSLQAAAPDRQWEVVNCGGVSYASYRLVPVVDELLTYEPDLVVLYTGHNEFLEDRSLGPAARLPSPVARAAGRLTRLHLVRLGYDWLWARDSATRSAAPEKALPEEVAARLDAPGGLQWYPRDPEWWSAVERDFAANIRRMLQACSHRHVPVLLCVPVANVRDCPPFKAVADPALGEQQRERLDAQLSAAARAVGVEERVARLRAVLEIDPHHAGALYDLGHALLELHAAEAAGERLQAAVDYDVCPLRIRSSMQQTLRQIAAETGTPLVDVAALFAGASPRGLPGENLLVDHVHPTLSGHQRVADGLLEAMVSQGVLKPRARWQEVRQERYRRHLTSLDEPYFLRGRQRLEALRLWSQGRAADVARENRNEEP